ncbi:ATP-binding protein [uncultured Oscillibacter sp.]|uniref:ATP-binding protein n=1 Tax=uncultured Oscillibacter sp. TaxID=876091 RepID=UPI003458616E
MVGRLGCMWRRSCCHGRGTSTRRNRAGLSPAQTWCGSAMAVAILDRLIHRYGIISTSGSSYRLEHHSPLLTNFFRWYTLWRNPTQTWYTF